MIGGPLARGRCSTGETGVPGWLPDRASSWIATHGAGRVNLEAAADAIYGSDTKTKPMHISSEESSPQ